MQMHNIFETYKIYKHSMNISNLTSQLKFVNRIGQTLSSEEIISLQSSVLTLSYEYKYEQFNFWGRVEGTLKNYYIVEGVNWKGATNFPIKKYFWSSEDFKFAELPAQKIHLIEKVKQISSFLTGQHEKILFKGQGQASKTISLDGYNYKVTNQKFSELDRLTIIVHLIDHECQVVPLGAYKMIPTHQIIANPSFRGLKTAQAVALQNYVHLRAPEHPQKKILIECDKALERDDFLDSVKEDAIKESWSVQTDESKTEVTIRSLVWPGYVSYHRANSTIHGGIYMGSGVRCYDLPFVV